MAKKLMPAEMINMLRDFRKEEPSGWLTVDDYLGFREIYPELFRNVKKMEPVLKQLFNSTAIDFMKSLSTDRPATNFNPQNKLGKSRPRWSKNQRLRLSRVEGL